MTYPSIGDAITVSTLSRGDVDHLGGEEVCRDLQGLQVTFEGPQVHLYLYSYLLSPQAKQGGFLYLTCFVFFYKIGEGMDTAYKSVTFAAKIGTWLDSNRLYLY